jgi:DNA (cytosine-5)-methyltransferase 1
MKDKVFLSVCDGMSCMQIALKQLGIKPKKYYASEIDKFAIKQTQLNFPDTIQLGDICNVNVKNLDKIDFISGGTPCTNFSFAGNRKGMATKENEKIYTFDRYLELKEQEFKFEGESYLFWEFIRILTDIRKYNNPDVKFLLENVEMGSKWEGVLSKAIGLFGVHINSALVSAQNRRRIYWTNIRTRKDGLFGELYSDIPQPINKGILLKDILENDVDEKYYLSKKGYLRLMKESPLFNPNKSYCLSTHNNTESGSRSRTMTLVKIDKKGNVKSDQNKASCFTTGAHSGGNHSDMDLICIAIRGRNCNNSDGLQQNIEPNITGKTNCITTVQKDNMIFENQEYIRRLTPTECARLQTIPEWYKWNCSETQQYKMLGNGWTVDVIAHILKFMN